MKCVKWVVIGVVALSLSGVALRAADEQKPADSTKTETKSEKKSTGRGGLFAPYSKMTSLSDDQKEKIGAIRKDFNAQRKELDKKEREQIFALLSDDQKKEAEKIEGEKKTGGSKKTASDAKSTDKPADSSSGEKKE
jgi:Spy/CpxP family protein refolding chaperone